MGIEFKPLFPGYGYFTRKAIQINPDAAEGKTHLVKYKEDDDKAYMKPEDIDTIIEKYESITIGCVGFCFC
eukprot:2905787-Ditylum_brightwellii.AAC.1